MVAELRRVKLAQRHTVIYNWNRAEKHGEWFSVSENVMGSLMTTNGQKLQRFIYK